jgi:hypothetical protein
MISIHAMVMMASAMRAPTAICAPLPANYALVILRKIVENSQRNSVVSSEISRAMSNTTEFVSYCGW